MSPHDRITSNSHTCFCEFVNLWHARMPPGEGRGSHGDSERPPEKSTDAVTLAPRYASKKRGKGFGTKAPAAPERFSLTIKEEGGEEERDQRAAVAVAETTPTATAPPAEGPPSAEGAAVEAGPTAEGAAVKAGDEAGEEKDPTPPMPESFDAAVKAEATPTAEGQLEEVAAVKADTDTEKEEVLVEEDVEIAAAAAKEAAALPTAEIPKRKKRRKRRRTQPRKSSSSHRDKRSPTPSPTNKRHGGGDGSPAPTPFEPCWKGSQSTSPSSARLPPQRRRRESESDSSRGYRPAPAHRRPSSSPDGARSSTPRTPRQRSRSSRRQRTPSRSPQWKRKGHGQRDGKNKGKVEGKALSRGKGHRHGGLICQRCGQLVKGTGHPAGDKASMDAHMQNSSKCLAAAGLRPAKEKCQYCGKLLPHGDRWARQQHSWHCWQRWHQR